MLTQTGKQQVKKENIISTLCKHLSSEPYRRGKKNLIQPSAFLSKVRLKDLTMNNTFQTMGPGRLS